MTSAPATRIQESGGARLFWLLILAAIFPPLAVIIEFGFCTVVFLVNIILTLLIPFAGFIHAAYLLCTARYSRAQRLGYEAVVDEPTIEVYVEPIVHYTDSPEQAQIASEPSQTPEVGPSEAAPPPYSTMDNKIQR